MLGGLFFPPYAAASFSLSVPQAGEALLEEKMFSALMSRGKEVKNEINAFLGGITLKI